MAKGCLEFRDVTFSYDPAATPIFAGVTVAFPTGWTGVIGANGSGKTTLLQLACGHLASLTGTVRRPEHVVYCPQRTDDPPEWLPGFLAASDGLACQLRGRLGTQADWAERWPTLSHGERKRAQIAAGLWRRPQLLAIDEPTNHIDLAARRLLAESLRSFRGIGLLVCHDRELLDTLCRQCLLLDPPHLVMRPGGYTKATAQVQAERMAARRAREQAKDELSRLQREGVR